MITVIIFKVLISKLNEQATTEEDHYSQLRGLCKKSLVHILLLILNLLIGFLIFFFVLLFYRV